MKSIDRPEESDDLAKIEVRLTEATVSSVKKIEPFHDLLTEVGGEWMLGWEHNTRRNPLGKAAGERMLRDRLEEVVPGMRKKLFPLLMRGLDVTRASVLIHVALIAGCDRLIENMDLWKALAKKDYKDAYNALMLTQWPPNSEGLVRRRVPLLALTLFTGDA